jgi:hypothetical protein
LRPVRELRHSPDARGRRACDHGIVKDRGRDGAARAAGGSEMAPRPSEAWLQGLLLALFVVLAVGAWSQLAGGLFLWR